MKKTLGDKVVAGTLSLSAAAVVASATVAAPVDRMRVVIDDMPMYITKNSTVFNMMQNEMKHLKIYMVIINDDYIPRAKFKELVIKENDEIMLIAQGSGG